MKNLKLNSALKFVIIILLGQIFLLNCIGKKMPEEVPLTIIDKTPSNNSQGSHFERELITRLKKNNIRAFRGVSQNSKYSLEITNNRSYSTSSRKSLSLGADCDYKKVNFNVSTNHVSVSMVLYRGSEAVKSWDFSDSRSGKIKERWLTKDSCDYKATSPMSTSRITKKLSKKARKQIANTIYRLEFD